MIGVAPFRWCSLADIVPARSSGNFLACPSRDWCTACATKCATSSRSARMHCPAEIFCRNESPQRIRLVDASNSNAVALSVPPTSVTLPVSRAMRRLQRPAFVSHERPTSEQPCNARQHAGACSRKPRGGRRRELRATDPSFRADGLFYVQSRVPCPVDASSWRGGQNRQPKIPPRLESGWHKICRSDLSKTRTLRRPRPELLCPDRHHQAQYSAFVGVCLSR